MNFRRRWPHAVDDYNREGLGIEADLPHSSAWVIRSLEQIVECREEPNAIRCEDGPVYVSDPLTVWVEKQGITL